ncbi:hypothetical protein ACN27E_10275 [Mycobacterium sp. WMMD1722]|uniref:hypothetical protein n=1 Tax=Mycobacterium sp. WMMD1722 TaxID=3404117 RepID=UPI003BF5FB16
MNITQRLRSWRREDRGWPRYMPGGRIRTSTAGLVVLFIALAWVQQTFAPEPAPTPPANQQVVPPGFVPDPDYTWVPRTQVQEPPPTRRPTSTTTTTTPTTTTTTPTTTTPTSPTSPTSPGSSPSSTPTTTVIDPDGPGLLPPQTVTEPAPASPSPPPAPVLPGLPGLPG